MLDCQTLNYQFLGNYYRYVWIHTPYRIGEMRVKWESKNELLRCKKGQTQTARFTLFYWHIYQISSARLKIMIYRPAEYQLIPPMQQQR